MTGTSSTRPSADAGGFARTVNVDGSTGVVVGDYNTVVQEIVERRKAPAWPQQIGLVPPTIGFLNRAEVATLDLAAAWGSTILVTGLGGVGKTQLAADFARRAQPIDLLVWVTADSNANAITCWSSVIP